MTTKFEKLVINPVIKVIQKKQDYLCKPENLPQLAKLGFIFNSLWYAGRVCYGYDGIIKKGSSCENNPKYEIGDNIKYNSEENENLIYDAWGMHVSNEDSEMLFDEFKKIVLEGVELSDFEKEYRKPNKTMDDWVKVLTDKQFRYSTMYPSKREVANHLLCVIGNGYGYNQKTGMVIREASGADQDEDLYGEWENAQLETSILDVVNNVLDVPECKLAMDGYGSYVIKLRANRKERECKERLETFGPLLKIINKERTESGKELITLDGDKFYDAIDEYLNDSLVKRQLSRADRNFEYYPICDYSIITMFDENTHPSYIQAGIEICEGILQNPPKNKPDYNQFQKDQTNFQTEFAQNFIEKWKL